MVFRILSDDLKDIPRGLFDRDEFDRAITRIESKMVTLAEELLHPAVRNHDWLVNHYPDYPRAGLYWLLCGKGMGTKRLIDEFQLHAQCEVAWHLHLDSPGPNVMVRFDPWEHDVPWPHAYARNENVGRLEDVVDNLLIAMFGEVKWRQYAHDVDVVVERSGAVR